MTKHDYTEFDAAIIDSIRHGKTHMRQLDQHKPLIEMAKPFCLSINGRHPQPEWRVIDRRLQALRKAGKIKHSSGAGWKIAE